MHGYYWGHRGWMGTGRFSCFNYGNSPLGFWLMIAIFVLVAVAIVLLIIGMRKKHRPINSESEAMAIIQRRYAKGELTNEEFQRMKKELQ